MSTNIGVVADDLTGAADALAPFSAVGYSCELLLSPGIESDAAVTATVTYSRALPPGEARERTRDAIATTLGRGRRPYLKIDSTMRGPIDDQLRGALEALRAVDPAARILVCPAYPSLGRTVEDGIVSVDGVPLVESVFASDPRNPVMFSSLSDFLPVSVHRDPTDLAQATAGEITTCDAVTDADLDAIARAALGLDSLYLSGSAGLARAWAAELPAKPGDPSPPPVPEHVLLVASSRHPTTLAQVDYLPNSLYSFLGDTDGSSGGSPVTVLTAQARFHPTDAQRVLDALARQSKDFVLSEQVDQLVLLGGDGAAAVLLALGAEAIRLRAARMPGHAEGTIRGGLADGLSVITRAGGFGTSTSLSDLLRLTLNR